MKPEQVAFSGGAIEVALVYQTHVAMKPIFCLCYTIAFIIAPNYFISIADVHVVKTRHGVSVFIAAGTAE